MANLQRITIDAHTKDGLACIRDTGITVSEVVNRFTEGSTAQTVFEMYPTLDMQDVLEALTYAVINLVQNIDQAFYLSGHFRLLWELNKAQAGNQHLPQVLYENAQKTWSIWFVLEKWSKLSYSAGELSDWERRPISFIIDQVTNTLRRDGQTWKLNVDVNCPNYQAVMRDRDKLTSAISILITDNTDFRSERETALLIGADDNSIFFEVHRKFDVNIAAPSEMLNRLFSAANMSSPISLARFIILQNGSELQIRSSDERIIFNFQLLIWKKPQL
jgi:uncharacterized protein (DUF433 family)